MTSRTWVEFTLSDDFKVRATITFRAWTMPVMYPASITTSPSNSNTAWVINTRIKTLLLCWRPDPQSSISTHVTMHDPARWTADSRRRCCRTKHGLIVIWIRETHNHRLINKHTCIQDRPWAPQCTVSQTDGQTDYRIVSNCVLELRVVLWNSTENVHSLYQYRNNMVKLKIILV